jgi:hypothetical protein
MKLHYEYLRQKNDKAMLAEFVRTYPIEEDTAPCAKRRRVHFAADAVQVAAEEVATEEVAADVMKDAIVMRDPAVQDAETVWKF